MRPGAAGVSAAKTWPCSPASCPPWPPARRWRKRCAPSAARATAAACAGWSARGMGSAGRSFPPLYRAMVAAGESSGALPQILERLAGLLERQQQVRGKLVAALVYPAALAVTAVAVVIALMTFVVPRVVEQFDSLGRELPWLTRAVIGMSEFSRSWGWLVLGALVAGALVLARLLRREGFRLRFDAWLLRLPLLGRTLRDLHAAHMARTLAIMLGSGLPLVEGLRITART